MELLQGGGDAVEVSMMIPIHGQSLSEIPWYNTPRNQYSPERIFIPFELRLRSKKEFI